MQKIFARGSSQMDILVILKATQWHIQKHFGKYLNANAPTLWMA